MLQQLKPRLAQINHEWWSKLTDGVLAAALLVLLWMTISLVIRPIEIVFGAPGLLLFVLVLITISVLMLHQSILARQTDSLRAYYGIAGGFLAWAVVEVTSHLDVPLFPGPGSVLLLVMAGLVAGVLWRSVLPIGARFFSLTFLLNWAGYLFAAVQKELLPLSPVFALAQRAFGALCAIGTLFVISWVLFRTRRRLQRLSGALVIWFLITMVIYAFRGSLY
jgi:hypothetical protein